MPIRFRCPKCHGLLAISSRRAGARVPCPTCGGDITVPDSDQPDLSTRPPVPDTHHSESVSVKEPPAAPILAARAPSESSDAGIFLSEKSTSLLNSEVEVTEDSGFVLTRRRSEPDELDLTAMVDVVFQLLIFFMVTASFSLQKTIEVPTPDQPRQGVSRSLQPLDELQDVAILVTIDETNRVLIDEEPVGDLSNLSEKLRDRMSRDRKSELILTASRNALHRTVIFVIDAANEVGMQRIRLAASLSEGN